MPTFRGYAIVSGTKYLGEVEADSEEEAENMFLASGDTEINLCLECADKCADAEMKTLVVEELT